MTKSIGKLKKDLDIIYSRYIRIVNSDDAGYVQCISCKKVWPWKQMQNGHFVSRRYSNLRYDERNTKPQCYGCNMMRGGNMANFAVALIHQYGDGIIDILAKESQVLKKFTKPELLKLTEHYKGKLRALGPEYLP